jgi:hypothetical protein
MLYRLTGGAWGGLISRPLQACTRTFPLAALLFLPILFGIRVLYPWADPSKVNADANLMQKSPYLNVTAFELRAAAYFLIWLILSGLYNAWSNRPTQDEAARRWLGTLSGPGLVLVGLADTFAGIDWQMSLEPHWYSTMFPVIFAVGQLLTALCLAILLVTRLAPKAAESDAGYIHRIHDLGSLLLMFVMMWAYVSFCQFLLIWSGNLPEEIGWYLPRITDGWQGFAIALVICHFMLPFILLLSRSLKRNPHWLGRLACFMLAAHFINVFWQVIPAFQPTALKYHVFDVVAVLVAIAGIGGVLLAMALGQLKNLPSVPWIEPPADEANAHA